MLFKDHLVKITSSYPFLKMGQFLRFNPKVKMIFFVLMIAIFSKFEVVIKKEDSLPVEHKLSYKNGRKCHKLVQE